MNSLVKVFQVAEIRKRVVFTLALLAVYRIGVFVTAPGVDRELMREYVTQGGQGGGFLGLFNMFSGGALENFSVFALGIMPYITASIIIQLLVGVVPSLERMQKEGGKGRDKINQYTRYGTMLIATVQAVLLSRYVLSLVVKGTGVVNPEWASYGSGIPYTGLVIVTLTAGTAFLMWLGERITERGVGNGISLIITAGIVARLPQALIQLYTGMNEGLYQVYEIVGLGILMLFVIFAIVFIERGQRRLPIHSARRSADGKQTIGQASHLPLKVNTAGVIPPIFASSLMMFPATAASFFSGSSIMASIQNALTPGTWSYLVVYSALIVFFAFFYTAMTVNHVDMADNLKRSGGFVPGIRPGKATADYIEYVLTRITTAGAIYLTIICILPLLVGQFTSNQVPFYFGGTGLLIAVGVALDTVSQIEGYLIEHDYDGFVGDRSMRIKGRAKGGQPMPVIG